MTTNHILRINMLKNKVALITGSAQGLGKGFATAVLQSGGKVCISDINRECLEATFQELKAQYGEMNVMYAECDVTDETQLNELFQKTKSAFSQIDIVVNNAGIVNEENWTKCIDVNLKGVISGTLLGIQFMRTDKGGNGGIIVNISSFGGVIPLPVCPAYSATKHGVIGYTRSWAMHPDVKDNGVRLMCLCPTIVNTNIISANKPLSQTNATIVQTLSTNVGILSIDQVTESFIKLLEDDENNGCVMAVTMKGSRYLDLFEEEQFYA